MPTADHQSFIATLSTPASLFRSLHSVLGGLWPMLILLLVTITIVRLVRSRRFKGWAGEAATARVGLGKLDARLYQVFNDLYLPRPDGKGTTQVDHVVVSPFGIFVIETKNLSGWLFGGEHDATWTQQFPRKRVSLQNPLRQNYLHAQALKQFLGVPAPAVVPVVFLIGGAVFKTPVPPGVLTGGLVSFITSHTEPRLEPVEVDRVSAALAAMDRATDRRIAKRAHLDHLKTRRQ